MHIVSCTYINPKTRQSSYVMTVMTGPLAIVVFRASCRPWFTFRTSRVTTYIAASITKAARHSPGRGLLWNRRRRRWTSWRSSSTDTRRTRTSSYFRRRRRRRRRLLLDASKTDDASSEWQDTTTLTSVQAGVTTTTSLDSNVSRVAHRSSPLPLAKTITNPFSKPQR